MGSGNPDDWMSATILGYVLVSDSAISGIRTRVAEIPFLTVLPISTVTGATDSMPSLICTGSAPGSIEDAMIMSLDAPMNGSKIRGRSWRIMLYILVQVQAHVSCTSLSEGVGVDLLMGARTGSASRTTRLAFARVGFSVCDRVGYQRRAIIWYAGGIDLVDRIANAIPDHADSV